MSPKGMQSEDPRPPVIGGGRPLLLQSQGRPALQPECRNTVLSPGLGLPSHDAHLSSRLGRPGGI